MRRSGSGSSGIKKSSSSGSLSGRSTAGSPSSASSSAVSSSKTSKKDSSKETPKPPKEALPTASNVEVARKYFSKCSSKAFTGHSRKIHTVGWNCTGKILGSGSVDGTARVFSLGKSGDLRGQTVLRGHTDCVDQIKFHPSDTNILASASGDKTVKVWDLRSGKCSQTVDTKGQNINLTWEPKGNYLAVGNKKDIISIIDARTFAVVNHHKFNYEVNEISWSPTGDHFLLTTGSGEVQVMDFPSFKKNMSLSAHVGHCYCLDFDRKKKYMATGGADAMVCLWDLNTLACTRTFPRLNTPIRCVSFSCDSRFIASASEELNIDISDVLSGKRVHTIECTSEINSIAWSPSALIIAIGGDDMDRSGKNQIQVFGFN